MRKREQAETTGRGSVRGDEILTMREMGRRLGLAARALVDAQREGLQTVLIGRRKMVLGADVLAYVRHKAEQQRAG